MTDETQLKKYELGQVLKSAIDLASENCGSKARMLAALGITESWMYALIRSANVPLHVALKLQVLTDGEYQWKDLCPSDFEEINAVKQYLK